jgi:hypothetical protein
MVNVMASGCHWSEGSSPRGRGASKGKGTLDPDLGGLFAPRIRDDDVDTPPRLQDDGRLFCPKRLIENLTIGLYLSARRLDLTLDVAVDLVDHLTKATPVFDEKCPLTVERSQMCDRLSPKGGHSELR